MQLLVRSPPPAAHPPRARTAPRRTSRRRAAHRRAAPRRPTALADLGRGIEDFDIYKPVFALLHNLAQGSSRVMNDLTYQAMQAEAARIARLATAAAKRADRLAAALGLWAAECRPDRWAQAVGSAQLCLPHLLAACFWAQCQRGMWWCLC